MRVIGFNFFRRRKILHLINPLLDGSKRTFGLPDKGLDEKCSCRFHLYAKTRGPAQSITAVINPPAAPLSISTVPTMYLVVSDTE
jgi:hypothetical protein